MMNAITCRAKLLISACCFALISAAAASAEIPSDARAPAQKAFLEKQMAFSLGTSVEIYKKSGLRDPKWDADVIQFINDATRRLALGEGTLEDLERRGRELYLRGCDDPMLQYMYGNILLQMDRMNSAERFIRAAADSLATQGYPANHQASAALAAYLLLNKLNRSDDAAKYADGVAIAVKAIFTDHVYRKNQSDLLIAGLAAEIAPLNSLQRQGIWKEAASVSGADPIGLLYLEGQYHVAEAWQKRGSGGADAVAPQAWQGFANELSDAERCLSQAWAMDKTIPEIPTAMIPIAMGGGDPAPMRVWFDRAVAARFDYRGAYDAYIYGLYPRWLGNRESLLAFADECFATGRFDTGVPAHYLDILEIVRGECDGGDTALWRQPEVYSKAKIVFDKAIRAGGVRGQESYYRGLQAAFAVRTWNWDDARQALDQNNGEVDANAARLMRLTVGEVQGAAMAYSGPGSDDALKGRDLAIGGKRRGAIAAYRAALALQQNPVAKSFLRGRIQILQWESDFAAGNEVALKADRELAGFYPAYGKWMIDGDGDLVATAAQDQILITCQANFGHTWNLTADVDFLRTQADWESTGIALTPPGTTDYFSFTVNPKKKTLVIRGTKEGGEQTQWAPAADHNQVVLRRRGPTIIASVNGQEVYRGDIAVESDAPLEVGLGGWPTAAGDVLRFRNVKIQRMGE